jgi:hypothetical protein
MAIELSDIIFTDQADIVPASGVEQIVNTGNANTLAGNDQITGVGDDNGIENLEEATFNTGDGNDQITGEGTSTGILIFRSFLDTGNGNDEIIGFSNSVGILLFDALFNTGDGNDTITGYGINTGIINTLGSILDTGEGNDRIRSKGSLGMSNHGIIITGSGEDSIMSTTEGLIGGSALHNYNYIDTGDDNDTLTSDGTIENEGIINTGNGEDKILLENGGIYNQGSINTGNGKDDIILGNGIFSNYGKVSLGDGNDSFLVDIEDGILTLPIFENLGDIETGDGNDIIFTSGAIYNQGFIKTGNGNDRIVVAGAVNGIGTGYGIYNNGGRIETGDGNDTIIAYDGFKSALNSSGAWFLGEGDDYIKGFGSGDFYGGNGNDTLELTPGTYTVGIWGEAGESPIFKKGDQLMITSEFETLIAGGTTYDFANLIADQIITVP